MLPKPPVEELVDHIRDVIAGRTSAKDHEIIAGEFQASAFLRLHTHVGEYSEHLPVLWTRIAEDERCYAEEVGIEFNVVAALYRYLGEVLSLAAQNLEIPSNRHNDWMEAQLAKLLF